MISADVTNNILGIVTFLDVCTLKMKQYFTVVYKIKNYIMQIQYIPYENHTKHLLENTQSWTS